MLPETDLIAAVAVGRRLQAVIAGAQSSEALQIRLSVGVAVLRADGTLETLVKREGEALYGTMTAGRRQSGDRHDLMADGSAAFAARPHRMGRGNLQQDQGGDGRKRDDSSA
jgi:hypothetical protein